MNFRGAGIALPVMAMLALLGGCGAGNGESDPGSSSGPVQTVRLETVEQRAIVGERRFVARVEALNTVDLAFQTGGRIERLDAVEGNRVEQGELLAGLEQVDYELAVRRARAALTLAEQEHQRNSRLREQSAVSQAAVDRSAAELEQREVALADAERNLAHTRLEAPFAALITRRLVEPFTQIQAGSPVLRLQDVSELLVNIAVPEDLMYTLEDTGRLSAELALASRPDRRFTVQYREHGTEPDPVTQTYPLSFTLPAPAPGVLPGMTGTVTVSVRQEAAQPGIDVPVAALDTRDTRQFRVWIYDAERGTVHPRPVEAGELGGDRVLIESGLEPGDTIVTAGAHLLQDGMRVTPFGGTGEN